MGVEWESSLAKSTQTIADTKKTISDYQAQNEECLKTLAAVGQGQQGAGDVQVVQQKIDKLTQESKQLSAAAVEVKAKATQTILANEQLVRSAPSSEPARTSHLLSDYLVGIETLGFDDDVRVNLNESLQKAGYGLHSLSASYKGARPSWFATRSTVFYYADSAAKTAQALADFMKDATGQTFQVRQGNGLGVDPSAKDVTLFVHYLKP
jgi:hypothetical protein